jgi:hypothetical protein
MRTRNLASQSRVKTVLVFGGGRNAPAVLSWISARAIVCGQDLETLPEEQLVCVRGPVSLSKQTLDHVRNTIGPLVNRMLRLLDQPPCRYELSIANIGPASCQDLGAAVTGFSADFSILVAMLAAVLKVEVHEDVVMTGHIASTDGDAAPVRSLDAKIAAVRTDPAITRFVHSNPRDDLAMSMHAPLEHDRNVQALIAAERRLETVAVRNVGELLPAVLDEGEIALGSLRTGFFSDPALVGSGSGPVARAVRHLGGDNTRRFWQAMEGALFEGDSDRARELLNAWVGYHIRTRRYPSGFGAGLRQLILCVPPAARRQRITFPLLPVRRCLALGLLGTDGDEEDIAILIDASLGRHLNASGTSGTDTDGVGDPPTAAGPIETVHRVLEAISDESLTQKIGAPLDTARVTCPQDGVTAHSHEEFMDVITAVYRHMVWHSRLVLIPPDDEMMAAEAQHLLEEAFARYGGGRAAEAEARSPTHGGLRLVIDRMADHLKEELKFRYVDRVLKEAVDPLDPQGKVEFMRALMEHMGNQLPPDVRGRPPEDFVEQRDALIRTYVQSRDRVAESFRGV